MLLLIDITHHICVELNQLRRQVLPEIKLFLLLIYSIEIESSDYIGSRILILLDVNFIFRLKLTFSGDDPLY